MRRSKAVVYLHLVWATQGREPFLTPEIEREIHRCVTYEAEQAGCTVLAIGGMPDHVHLVIKFPTTLSIAELMKRIKGVSSALGNDLQRHARLFRWQEGYAVFSISRSHCQAVIAYVVNQKQHHAEGTLHSEWEETDEEVPPKAEGA